MSQLDNETIFEQLLHDFHGVLTWKWDDWVGSFLAEFNIDQESKVRPVLQKHLPISWDSSNINQAPKVVLQLDDYLGGIRPTQYLFSSDPSDEAFVFCAWWPWGNGSSISLRIAPYNRNLSKSEDVELKQRLMVLAGIETSG